MFIIKKAFFVISIFFIFNAYAVQIDFDGQITRLEHDENDNLIVQWDGGQKVFSNIVRQEGMNLKTIAMFNAQPAIVYDSVSSSVKSQTYFTLKREADNIFIDCMYFDAYRGELFDKYGVCNLRIALDENYVDTAYATAGVAAGLDFYSPDPFDVGDFEEFIKNARWPLIKKLHGDESMSFNLQYESQAAFDDVEPEYVVRYKDKSCTFGSASAFVIFELSNLDKPIRIEVAEAPSYEKPFRLFDWYSLKIRLDQLSINDNKFLCSSLFVIPNVLMAESNVEILISAEKIKNQNPDEFILDGKVEAYINDDQILDTIEYFYMAETPPVACGLENNCDEINAQFMGKPTLTFDIIINDTTRISGHYFCDSIGLIKSSYTEGMADLFCGPSYQLRWNGEDYLLVED